MTTEVSAGGGFDIMGHDRAGRVAFGPEPDERETIHLQSLHGNHEKFFRQNVDAAIHRPTGESYVVPTLEVDLLQVFPDRNRKHWAQPVINVLRPGSLHPTLACGLIDITFISKIVDNLT